MPFIEARLGPDGEPLLLIVGKQAGPEIMAELATMGKSLGPDELAVELPFEYLAEFALVGISNELDKQRASEGRGTL